MYVDHFSIENAAEQYRTQWQAEADRERLLALLPRVDSLLATVRARLAAVSPRVTWRGFEAPVVGRNQSCAQMSA